MKMFQFLPGGISMLLVLALITGCGKKSADGQQQSQQQTESNQSSDSKSSNPFEQMTKAAEEMSKAMGGDQKPVPAVSYKILMGFLPTSYNNMKVDGPEGESASYGEWNFSTAKVRFSSEDGSSSAEIDIFDYAHIGLLYAPFQMLFNMKYAKESSRGYERSTKIGGFPAFEKWENDSKDGELTLLVSDRFIVTVKTNNLAEGAAKELISKIDLSKLGGVSVVVFSK